MSDDEPEPPEEVPEVHGSTSLDDKKYAADFEARVERSMTEVLGPPRRPRPPKRPSHWPELSSRINHAATMHAFNPEKYPLEMIDRFECLGTIGEGGFGTVFRVRDPELGRTVALKLCRPGQAGAQDVLLDEGKILATIKHDNIITVHEVGRYGEASFLVTEYVHGLNMYEHALEEEELLRWEVVLELFIGVGETLADAHDKGVIHGDLKPDNIIVERATQATFLVDFGLGRIMSPTPLQLARESGALGTLYYMAPELHRGGQGNRLSDQYAFAVSLWQSLEGWVPYLGTDSASLLEAIDYGEPMRWRPDVPARVYEVIRKGFSEKPGDRYADMRAFVRALALARGPRPVAEPVDAGEKVEVSPSEGVEGPRRAVKKGVVFGLALALAGAGVLAELSTHREQESSQNQEQAQLEEPLRESPQAVAMGGFRRSFSALDRGDLRAVYERWAKVVDVLAEHDPQLAGELSLLLANLIADKYSSSNVAASWAAAGVAIGAAEAFDKAKLWDKAKEARECAAKIYDVADTPEPAD